MSTEPEGPSTGRLFRASSVDDDTHTDAIPALASPRAAVSDVLPDSAFRAEESPFASEPEPGTSDQPIVEPVSHAATRAEVPGLSTLWVWIIIVGVTVVMAIADVLVRKQGLGWLTGVGVLAATIYCAVASRRDAMWWSVIAAPIAVAIATITVGQISVSRTGSFVITQGLNLLDSLGRVAPFTIAAVIAAIVIALVRRSRAKRAQQP